MAFEPQYWLTEDSLYRLLGIVPPLLMVGMAAGTIIVNSATHLSNVRRTSARLESWLRLSDKATEQRAIVRDVSARGVGASLDRFAALLWLIVRVKLTRRKYLDDVETIRRRDRKAFIDRQLPALEGLGGSNRGDIGSLFSDLRDGVRGIGDKGRGQALVVGVATSVLAFAIAKAQAPSIAAGLAEYGTATVVLAMLLLVAIVYVLGGIGLRWCRADRRTGIGAFAWGSSIPLFLGLNALESSALGIPGNDGLHDAPTVGLAVVCMVLMFVVREVLYHRYRAIAKATHDDRSKVYRIVGETLWFASDGGRREAWLRTRIGVCYMLAVVPLLVPPIRDMALCGTMCEDLVAVTAVAAVTLMVPLVAAFMDGRTQIRDTM